MNDRFEVISAFLDDELFDPGELTNALTEPAGRALLLDLVALRHIVQPHDVVPAGLAANVKPRSSMRAFMVAAAVFVALAGGYLAGQRRSEPAVSAAPAPSRVVQGPQTWQEIPRE